MKFLTAALVAAFLLPAVANAETCKASFYHEGQMTANGERFNPEALTAAHPSLPFGARVRVTYHGQSVVVRINDRGPAKRLHRCIDISRAAARAIGMIHVGVASVQIERIS